jgi:hypothetical protein
MVQNYGSAILFFFIRPKLGRDVFVFCHVDLRVSLLLSSLEVNKAGLFLSFGIFLECKITMG